MCSCRSNICVAWHTAGLLLKLLEAQRLDVHDIEAIYPLYMHACQQADSALGHGTTVGIRSNGAQPQQPHSAQKHLPEQSNEQLYIQSLLQKPHHEQLEILRKYLLAATAKDCSILITLQMFPDSPSTASQGVVDLSVCHQPVQYQVAVIDLDTKSSAKIPLHYVLDSQLTG